MAIGSQSAERELERRIKAQAPNKCCMLVYTVTIVRLVVAVISVSSFNSIYIHSKSHCASIGLDIAILDVCLSLC
jgi:hypothetical protein